MLHPADLTAVFDLPDEAATLAAGAALGAALRPGMVVWLQGDLGAGKTTMVRALLRSLGHQGPVKSPTYSLVEVYVISSLYLYHFDFYRFESPEEFLDAGMDEYFRDDAACLVEWPERAQGCVPPPDLCLVLRYAGTGRQLEVTAYCEGGDACVRELASRLCADASFKAAAPPSSSP
ncbi:MAG: tRNA (adenosine(37)-N6)-threonylcarbamoyltransferase complex ATPase subunit type 1 TsaE [Dechloromonas sp.]|nr:tRNA (adenosine(37)-N6)-threonylcarbamoyltransferase complex ATPase subunit type 1 TsaE [Dechloromonas sp.]